MGTPRGPVALTADLPNPGPKTRGSAGGDPFNYSNPGCTMPKTSRGPRPASRSGCKFLFERPEFFVRGVGKEFLRGRFFACRAADFLVQLSDRDARINHDAWDFEG